MYFLKTATVLGSVGGFYFLFFLKSWLRVLVRGRGERGVGGGGGGGLLSCIVNGVLLLIRSAVCDIDYAVFTSPQYSAPRLCLVSLKFMSSCGRPAESIAVSFSVSFCRPTFFFYFR